MAAIIHSFNQSIEKAQKEAQDTELSYENTSPSLFVGLTLLQFAVIGTLSHWMGSEYYIVFILAFAGHLMGYLYSLKINSCFHFDVTGEITFFVILAQQYVRLSNASSRQTLVFLATLVWVTRLGYFLFKRILVRGKDWRFQKMVNGRAYALFCWISQATWIWLVGMCIWTLNSSSPEPNNGLNLIDYLGLLIWGVGMAIEHISDQQKSEYNAQIRSGEQKEVIQSGFWKLSRHPNYFGEIVLWVGLALMSCCGTNSLGSFLLTFISPIWAAFFLIFTSLMLLEKRLDNQFGDAEWYKLYKKNTPVLFPEQFRV